MTHAVSIKGLSKRFGRTQALHEVSFEVPSRSIFGLLGPNGAGKTTLFSLTANFLKASAGTVEVLGIDTRYISRLQGRLSILPQDAEFQRNVPILDQLVFFRRLAGRTKQQAHEEVLHTLDMVGLQAVAKRRVSSLSHGMIKRLGVAQAFLGHPEVILLDEPTSGLDPANARQVRDLVRQLQERATILVSSHNLAEIQDLCDHVAILDHGRLVLAGSVDAITRSRRECHLGLSRALQNGELERLLALPGLRSIEPTSAATGRSGHPLRSVEYLVKLDLSAAGIDQDTGIAALLKTLLDLGITPRKLTEGRSLESQFLEVTGHPPQFTEQT
ncbi:MAG: ABC transporter ATP-binding protein [Planctomycetes bacterium]|nr:ABC transporter ATP-binding protein [Planctomycetota bacterium]